MAEKYTRDRRSSHDPANPISLLPANIGHLHFRHPRRFRQPDLEIPIISLRPVIRGDDHLDFIIACADAHVLPQICATDGEETFEVQLVK